MNDVGGYLKKDKDLADIGGYLKDCKKNVDVGGYLKKNKCVLCKKPCDFYPKLINPYCNIGHRDIVTKGNDNRVRKELLLSVECLKIPLFLDTGDTIERVINEPTFDSFGFSLYLLNSYILAPDSLSYKFANVYASHKCSGRIGDDRIVFESPDSWAFCKNGTSGIIEAADYRFYLRENNWCGEDVYTGKYLRERVYQYVNGTPQGIVQDDYGYCSATININLT